MSLPTINRRAKRNIRLPGRRITRPFAAREATDAEEGGQRRIRLGEERRSHLREPDKGLFRFQRNGFPCLYKFKQIRLSPILGHFRYTKKQRTIKEFFLVFSFSQILQDGTLYVARLKEVYHSAANHVAVPGETAFHCHLLEATTTMQQADENYLFSVGKEGIPRVREQAHRRFSERVREIDGSLFFSLFLSSASSPDLCSVPLRLCAHVCRA